MDKIEFKLNLATVQNGIFAHVSIFINEINILDFLKCTGEDGRLYDNHSELCIDDLCNILYYKNHDEWNDDGRITILGCICGDRDCGPFKVRLNETSYSVIWEDFHGRINTNPMINKFEFEKSQYSEQIESLSKMLKSQSVIKMMIDMRRFKLEDRQLN